MNDKHIQLLKEHYHSYNYVIKPLIAAYEARELNFPIPIFNEIRAFNDHVSRCYLENTDDAFKDKQLIRAGRHISRIILDLYKYLIVSFDDAIKNFEKNTENVDLSIISNGAFYVAYSDIRERAIKELREAKRLEAASDSDQDAIYKKFEVAFNLFQETEDLISSNIIKINWAKKKSNFKRYLWLITTILSGIVSWLLADLLNWSIINSIWSK